jgi:hypothetical protein
MEGTKMICDHRTVIREEGEITPIKTLMQAVEKTVARKTMTKLASLRVTAL